MTVKWSAFAAGSAIAAANEVVGLQSGVNVRWTYTQVAAFLSTATLAAGTITTSQPMTLTQTWNNAGVSFIGASVDISVTASSGSSRVARWRTGAAGTTELAFLREDGYFGAFAGYIAGSDVAAFVALFNGFGGALLGSDKVVGWTSSANWFGTVDTILTRGGAAASLQHGATDVDLNANIVAQTIRSQGALTGGTADQAGKDWSFIASPGKGTGAGGSFLFKVAPAGSTGSTTNTAVTALSIASTGVANVAANTATPAAGSTSARLLFGTTAGFGIYYGSDAPTVSAAQGSLYLRSNGDGVANRAYINTNGTTGWTAIATAG